MRSLTILRMRLYLSVKDCRHRCLAAVYALRWSVLAFWALFDFSCALLNTLFNPCELRRVVAIFNLMLAKMSFLAYSTNVLAMIFVA